MILPVFSRCFKQKKNFRIELKMALLKKLKIQVPLTEYQIESDPYILLGFGVNSYFDLLQLFCIMMLIISAISLPIFYMYSTGNAYNNEDMLALGKYMMGNLGASDIYCDQEDRGRDHQDAFCSQPDIFFDTSKALYGLINADLYNKHSCTQEHLNMVMADAGGGKYNCSVFIDHQKVDKYLKDNCHGKQSCEIRYDGFLDPSKGDANMLAKGA